MEHPGPAVPGENPGKTHAPKLESPGVETEHTCTLPWPTPATLRKALAAFTADISGVLASGKVEHFSVVVPVVFECQIQPSGEIEVRTYPLAPTMGSGRVREFTAEGRLSNESAGSAPKGGADHA